MRQFATGFLIAATCCLTACAVTNGDDDPDVSTVGNESVSSNGLSSSVLLQSVLVKDSDTAHAFLGHSLKSPANSVAVLLHNAPAYDVYATAVKCALPKDREVTVTVPRSGTSPGGSAKFKGAWGLAPEWETRACVNDDRNQCINWISACMIALMNYQDATVNVQLVAAKNGLDTSQNFDKSYAREEGSYYGRLFNLGGNAQPMLFGCQGDNAQAAVSTTSTTPLMRRICGDFKAGSPAEPVCRICAAGSAGCDPLGLPLFANEVCHPDPNPKNNNDCAYETVRNCSDLCSTAKIAGTNISYNTACLQSPKEAKWGQVVTVFRK